MVATIALLLWCVVVALGLTMLVRWRRPPRTAFVHLTTAVLGLAAWLCYLVADRPGWLAWVVFAWLVLVNTLGDLLMLSGWRGRTPEPRPRGARAYLAAAGEALKGRRPVQAAHAVLAATTFVLVLLTALGL